jgi:hypothetical protein
VLAGTFAFVYVICFPLWMFYVLHGYVTDPSNATDLNERDAGSIVTDDAGRIVSGHNKPRLLSFLLQDYRHDSS